MRRNIIVCLIAVTVAAIFTLACTAGYQLRAQSGQWQPYTIFRTTDSTNSAMGHRLQRLEIVARRSDGSRVVIDSADPSSKSEFGVRDIVLTPEHKRIHVSGLMHRN